MINKGGIQITTEMDSVFVSIDGHMRRSAISFAGRKLSTLKDTVKIRNLRRKERDLRIGHLGKEAVLRVLRVHLGIASEHITEFDRVRQDRFIEPALWELKVGTIRIDVRSSMEPRDLSLRQIVNQRHHLGYCLYNVTFGTPPVTRPIRDFEKSGLKLPELPGITAEQVEDYIRNNTRIKDLIIRVYFLNENETVAHVVGWVTKEELIRNGIISQLYRWPKVTYHLILIRDGRPMDELRRFLREKGEIG